MTIKTWLIGTTALAGAIGTAVIANDVGNAVTQWSNMRDAAHRQELSQRQSEWEQEQEIRQELLQSKIDFQETVWYTLRWSTPLVLVASCATAIYLFIGWTDSEVRKARFEATQLKMDPKTRTFPLVVFEAGNKLRIHDPNSKMTLALDQDNEAVPFLVANSIAVQLQSLSVENDGVIRQETNLPLLLEMANDYLSEKR